MQGDDEKVAPPVADQARADRHAVAKAIVDAANGAARVMSTRADGGRRMPIDTLIGAHMVSVSAFIGAIAGTDRQKMHAWTLLMADAVRGYRAAGERYAAAVGTVESADISEAQESRIAAGVREKLTDYLNNEVSFEVRAEHKVKAVPVSAAVAGMLAVIATMIEATCPTASDALTAWESVHYAVAAREADYKATAAAEESRVRH